MAVKTLIASLKRLYSAGKVKDEKLNEMVVDGKITEEEFAEIISK